MKVNENQGIYCENVTLYHDTNFSPAVLTPRLLLVPYSSHHVPTYHEWMQDEVYKRPNQPLTIQILHITHRYIGTAEAHRIRAANASGRVRHAGLVATRCR